ncbi:type I-F CRISPR-associated helicase Cas3f [Candidatus Berkiella cookevillensis]|uniref:CRISPR-associated nuclease/helicase Cas3 subtype I-F/YPEST n=1 Tax=Candidatus Berkiella cookevillensis TaxID=437022 RepID=A0A0Q9YM38_9GAMM|nr:type I-F CRISPR-associated helicase Cas3f [Candidatus Berkiella cookevillensis]MCS5709106.1 type I-F CRISPR-associated helicase Cas3f [Candidatus Berkiella cookevillensis]
MMVTFISQCEKNALKKTRRVLDAFADRIGDNTWQTVITEEGLKTVKKMLKQTASKSTSVSCHWIRSRSRTEFLWVVGNKLKFNEQGVVPVNITSKSLNIEEHFSFNTIIISLLSYLAGLFHDIGKATVLFQGKLDPGFSGIFFEPYRHEWVSLRIFQAFVNGRDDKGWLEELANVDNSAEDKMMAKLALLRDGIDTNPEKPFETLPPVAKLVAWLIVSHHKLPQYPKNKDNPPTFESMEKWISDNFEACWNSPQCLNDDWQESVIKKNWSFPYGTPLKSAHWQTQASIVAKKILRCDRMFEQDWFNQHFTAHIARLSLMLSDHYYSSKKETSPEWQDRNYHAYANTDKDEYGNKYKKQKLDEHNIVVGINACDIAMALPKLRSELPPLKYNRSFITKVPRAYQENFGWQDKAYDLALAIKDDTKKYGFFGVCMASTGKGKTRANARIMYGLSDEETCRFSVALGLRTLTLQTGDALKRDLNLEHDELSVLIGSQAVKDLHQQSQFPEDTEQQKMGSESAESLLKDEITLIEGLPDYNGICAKWLKHDPKILKLVQAPVLVSTIDYLMPASEGIRGGRQIAPMLRLLTSDLVLDEPDDFGLEDLPALCRLVNWAGMLGSRVLLSTATISPSLASTLFLAYQTGRKHYTQVNGEHGQTAQICCAWFDEFKRPQSELIADAASFKDMHNGFVNKRIINLKNKTNPLRKAKLISIAPNLDHTPAKWMAMIIRQSIEILHQQHALIVAEKKVTIGLVRMANIDPLVQVSKYLLAQDAPEDTVIHYCVYHSQFPLLHRSKIEKQLDGALLRHDEKDWLEKSGVKDIVEKYPEKNHVFVVLATAVAEVGRDHDYDWAVVEPSSMRSIIQLAGRIQRHRQQVSQYENIHILSKNFKGLKGKSPCFEKPGFESDRLSYASRDLEELVNVNEFDEINAIARIQTPTSCSLTEEKTPRFKSFNELEHFAQTLRLVGSVNELNHASQWWNNEATWCGELQRLQPFRQSCVDDDFNLKFTRTGKVIWQKKVPKTSSPQFENTTDIAMQPEQLVIGLGNRVWGEFILKDEFSHLVKVLSDNNEDRVMKKFTHLSLRRLDENSAEQWQYHPMLGVYKVLKKDEYK